MPRYRVLQPCFFDGKLYDPRGKRPVYETSNPLNPVPPTLELIQDEEGPKPKSEGKKKAKSKK